MACQLWAMKRQPSASVRPQSQWDLLHSLRGFMNLAQHPDLGTLEKHKTEKKQSKKVSKERTYQHNQGFLVNSFSLTCPRPETAVLLLSSMKVYPVKQPLLDHL